MLQQSSYTSHSAQVDIELRLNGAILPVSQLGPGFLILTQATDGHPPTNARLFMQVDDSCEEWTCLPS